MTSKYAKALTKGARIVRSALLDRRPTVAYVGGWLGKRNLGDEALLHAYERLFPSIGLIPFDGGRLITAIAGRTSLFKCGLLAGGTLIGEQRALASLVESFFRVCPHLVVFGTGVESAEFWPGEASLSHWKGILESCSFVGVRGPISAALLSDFGIKRVEVVGDPVLAFARDEIAPSPIPQSIGLNIGVADGRLWGGKEEPVRDEMARLAKLAKTAGWSVKWLVVWPKDLAITRQAAYASGTAIEVYEIYEDQGVFLETVRPLSVFVGMKLHATVLATCALTPSVMLEYRPKCLDYMRSIGQEAATFRTDRFRADEVWELVRDWDEHRRAVSLALATGIRSLKEKQRALAAEVSRHFFAF